MDNKIVFQNVVKVCLYNNDRKYLLISRSHWNKYGPGEWYFFGGLMESNDSLEKHLLKIKNETGIEKINMNNLKLRYIIIYKNKNIIRQENIYFGEINVTELIEKNREYELYWIPENKLMEINLSEIDYEMIKHYIKTPNPEERIIVGIAGKQNNMLKIYWSIMDDLE